MVRSVVRTNTGRKKYHRHTSRQTKWPVIFTSHQQCVMITRFLPEFKNSLFFTRMSKINPNVSSKHDSRLSCSVYAFNHVDLYHGLQRVCSRHGNEFIFLSVYWELLLFIYRVVFTLSITWIYTMGSNAFVPVMSTRLFLWVANWDFLVELPRLPCWFYLVDEQKHAIKWLCKRRRTTEFIMDCTCGNL